jgi:lysine-N-methylase
MKISVPEYYTKFKCIADKCKDNCCIGWEIDVDESTLDRYNRLSGDERERIRSTMNDGNPVTFKLVEDEKCANLDSRGLCKIISSLGEDYLCQICRDHPRYFNQTSQNYEGGIGLACEEAARLILTSGNETEMVEVDYHEITPRYVCDEELPLKTRELIFSYLNGDGVRGDDVKVAINRLLHISALLDSVVLGNLFSKKQIDITPDKLQSLKYNAACDDEVISVMCSAFDDAEALTDDFHSKRKSAIDATSSPAFYEFLNSNGKKYFINLLCYFIHRYFLCGEADYIQSMGFAIASSLLICAIVYAGGDYSIENFIEEAKNFSKNVEYSEENVGDAMENMGKIIRFY